MEVLRKTDEIQLKKENEIKIDCSYCAEHNGPPLQPEDGDTLSLQN